MNPLIKRLHEQRTHAELEIRSTIDTADAEKRELSVEDNTKIDELDKLSRSLNDNLTGLIEAEQRSADVDAALGKYGPPAAPEVTGPSDTELLRSLVSGEKRSMEFRAPNTSPLSKLSAGAGLNAVPTSFYDHLIEAMLETSTAMAAGATVLNTDSGENIQIPTAASADYPAA